MMPGYGRLNFFVLAYPIHGTKILGKTDRQGLSSSGVIVIDNQAEWFHKSPLEFTAVAVGPAATASCYHRRSQIRARNSVTFATPSRSGARTVQFGAFRSVLTESQLFLPLPPIVSGKSRKAACLLRRELEISPVEPPLFPAPGRSSLTARGIPQTSPIHFAPVYIVMPFRARNVQQNLAKFVISWALAFPKGNSTSTVAKLSAVAKLDRGRAFRAKRLQNIHCGR